MAVEFWAEAVEKLTNELKGPDLLQFLFPTALTGFVGCAAALYWFPGDNTLLKAMVGCAIAAAGSGARLWNLRQLRSRLVMRSVFDAEYFWGRAADIQSLIDEISFSAYVWVFGNSGVGKSSLFRKGVVTALKENSNLVPLYIWRWGTHWVDGPCDALGLAIDGAVTPATVKQAVRDLKIKVNRTPVLIFDQFDDYLVKNRSEFVSRNGKVITGKSLRQRNSFWDGIAELNASGEVRCVFVTRSDIQWGRASVRFRDDDTEFEVPRLDRSVLADFLQAQTKPEVIANAEHGGWEDLRERLVADLSEEGGLLPIQVRLALSGLGELRTLTLDEYIEGGGVAGLIAMRINDMIQRACQTSSPALETDRLRRVLLELVDLKEKKAVECPESKLIEMLPDSADRPKRLQRALDFLARQEIVREVSRLSGEDRSWRLDHDYLCIPIIRLDKERNPWRHKLDTAYAAYQDATGLWKKYQGLLSPISLLRICVEVARGRFQLGTKRRFALLSLAKLALSPILLVALAGGWILWDSRIEAEAQEIVNGLGVSPFERAPWALRRARFSTRRRVVDKILADQNLARRVIEGKNNTIAYVYYLNLPQVISRSAFLGSRERAQVVQNEISRRCYGGLTQIASYQVLVCAAFVVAWDADTSRVANFLVEAMKEKGRSPSDLSALASDLGALGGKVAEGKAGEGAGVLVEAMKEKGRSPSELSALASGLGALSGKAAEAKAGEGADILVKAMKGKDGYDLDQLEKGLGALGGKVAEGKAGELADVLVAEMKEKGRMVFNLSRLASGLGALGGKVAAGKAGELAGVLVAAMKEKGRSPEELSALATGLGALGGKVAEVNVDEAAGVLVAAMKEKEISAGELSALATGLGALRGKVAEGKAGEGAGVLVAAIREQAAGVPLELYALTSGLGALGGKLSEGMAGEGAGVLVAAMKEKVGRSLGGLYDLARGLGALGGRVAEDKAGELAGVLVEAMKEKGRNSDELYQLARGLGALGGRVADGKAGELAGILVDAIKEKGRSPSDLSAFASGLGALGGKVAEGKAGEGAGVLIEAMKEKGRSPSDLSALARGLGALGRRVPIQTAQVVISNVLPRMPQLGVQLPCEELADLARAKETLDIQWLVELIQAPSCNAPEAVLQQLGKVTGQSFGSTHTAANGKEVFEPDWRHFHEWIDRQDRSWTILPTFGHR